MNDLFIPASFVAAGDTIFQFGVWRKVKRTEQWKIINNHSEPFGGKVSITGITLFLIDIEDKESSIKMNNDEYIRVRPTALDPWQEKGMAYG